VVNFARPRPGDLGTAQHQPNTPRPGHTQAPRNPQQQEIDAVTDAEADKPPRLDDAVIISEFWANRRGESVRIQIRTYEGRRVIDLRKFFTDKASGQLRPTRKGLTLALVKLPDLAKGINKACAAASDLGLFDKAPGNE
jgi:hypothetical protein